MKKITILTTALVLTFACSPKNDTEGSPDNATSEMANPTTTSTNSASNLPEGQPQEPETATTGQGVPSDSTSEKIVHEESGKKVRDANRKVVREKNSSSSEKAR